MGCVRNQNRIVMESFHLIFFMHKMVLIVQEKTVNYEDQIS